VTLLEVVYRYGATPGEAELRAIDNVREVYGIRRITFSEKDHTVRVEFDVSRLRETNVANLLRSAGLDLGEKLVLA
jgi:hypothetical protein